MKTWLYLCFLSVMIAAPAIGPAVKMADAALVTQLDLTGGAVNWTGPHGRMLDRLFEQSGTITMGAYQADIVEPMTRGHKTFSLFTTGLWGAPPPTAVINGNSITVDLSSLVFGWRKGDHMRLWNIGGQATGLFNPQTSEFCLSWEHLLGRGKGQEDGIGLRRQTATFFLSGIAQVGTPAAVVIPATVLLYATGLFGIGSWACWKRRRFSSSRRQDLGFPGAAVL